MSSQFMVCLVCPEDETQFMVPYSGPGDFIALALMGQHLKGDHDVIDSKL